jgi:uncharacterized membrane protein
MDLLGLSFAFHLIGINLWIGAAFLFSLAVLPALGRMDPDRQMEFLKTFNRRYIPWFIAGGIVVGITGWFQTFDIYTDLNLVAAYSKHAVILLLIFVSVVEWLLLSRRLSMPIPDRLQVWGWYVALAWIQTALGAVILFLTGWLTQ